MAFPVHTRTLLPQWANALASGEKPFETQRYVEYNRNAMKFGKEGTLVVVGTKGSPQVMAVAEIQQVQRHACNSVLKQLVESIDEQSLKDELTDYLIRGKSVDVMYFSTVYDVRPLHVTWAGLETKVEAKISRNSGFPRIDISWCGYVGLQEILERPGVIKRQYKWPILEDSDMELTSEPDVEDNVGDGSGKAWCQL